MITEQSSSYDNLEQKSTYQLLTDINDEDKTVPLAVKKAIPNIEKLIEAALERMQKGGRLFYIGAGTSGRLGILDASELPPTYGVRHDLAIGLIAGGDQAIRKAVEFAEDDPRQAWKDLQAHSINRQDTLIGIAASGKTPYVVGGVRDAAAHGVLTGAIVCNYDSPLAKAAQFPIEVIVGPEYVTGSTRMKAGTAQKLVLNMISTTLMIRLGRVKGNKMVDMQLSNQKLLTRGERFLVTELSVTSEKARQLLEEHGSVRKAAEAYKKGY